MSDDKLPPLDKVIAACKIGFNGLGPNALDLAAAAWLERQQTEIERLREVYLIAEDVVWYDWSNNDSDAVHTIEQLRLVLGSALKESRTAIGGLMP